MNPKFLLRQTDTGGIDVKSDRLLGAVILDSTRSTSTKEVRRFVIIDGQQRLTTFQLLLAAIRDVANYRNHPHVARATERCLLNPDFELMEKPEVEQYKLWPTHVNRDAFCKVISAGSYKKVHEELFPVIKLPRKRKPEPRERLAEAYEFFYEKINDVCNGCDCDADANDLLISILGVLREDFTVVEIILGDSDDSQEIFNSLNARGKPLSQSDLLRSYIFMRAEKMALDRDRLYDEYWSRFENEWWDMWVRRGTIYAPRLDALTRNILAAKLGCTIDVKRVHSAYANWIETYNPYMTLEDELREFVLYGTFYEQLQGKTEGILSSFGDNMGTWDTSTVLPLVMFLAAEGGFIEHELCECLGFLESFIIRRAVCGLVTKEYNKYFIEIISRLRKTGLSVQSLADILLSGEGDIRRFPTNEEFEKDWRTKPVYDRLNSSQIVMILRQLESKSRSSRAEASPILQISVEHVMPQHWTDNYPLNGEIIPKDMNTDWYYSTSPEDRERHAQLKPDIIKRRVLIHTIGNLTAVTHPLNSAMKNTAFAEKKGYFRESVLALNRYFDTVEEWDELAIQVRADKLFQHAMQAWPVPKTV